MFPILNPPPSSLPIPSLWVVGYAMLCYAKSLQAFPTLCDPHRRQPTRLPRPWDSPGKNAGVGFHFLLHYMKVKRESEVAQSCPTLCDHMDTRLRRPWDFLGKRTGVGCPFLRHGIFPTQGSYPGLPHSRQTLYRQSHQGSWADWVGGGVVQRGGGAHQELGSGTSSVT